MTVWHSVMMEDRADTDDPDRWARDFYYANTPTVAGRWENLRPSQKQGWRDDAARHRSRQRVADRSAG